MQIDFGEFIRLLNWCISTGQIGDVKFDDKFINPLALDQFIGQLKLDQFIGQLKIDDSIDDSNIARVAQKYFEDFISLFTKLFNKYSGKSAVLKLNNEEMNQLAYLIFSEDLIKLKNKIHSMFIDISKKVPAQGTHFPISISIYQSVMAFNPIITKYLCTKRSGSVTKAI